LVARVLLREARRRQSWAAEEEEAEEEVSTCRVTRHTCRDRKREGEATEWLRAHRAACPQVSYL